MSQRPHNGMKCGWCQMVSCPYLSYLHDNPNLARVLYGGANQELELCDGRLNGVYFLFYSTSIAIQCAWARAPTIFISRMFIIQFTVV
jgi:hypothetical protein